MSGLRDGGKIQRPPPKEPRGRPRVSSIPLRSCRTPRLTVLLSAMESNLQEESPVLGTEEGLKGDDAALEGFLSSSVMMGNPVAWWSWRVGLSASR